MTRQSYPYDEDELKAAAPPAGFTPIVSHSRFGWRCGPIFERTDGDSWTRGFRVSADHVNSGGFCHGGMLMTAADIFLATAVYKAVEAPHVTVHISTDFMAAAPLGSWVSGTARLNRQTASMAFVDGELYADDKICLKVSGIFKRIGRK